MTIRDATPSDLAECARFFSAVFNVPPWNESWSEDASLARLSDCMATPHFLGLLATGPEGLQGMAFGYSQRYQEEWHYHLLEFFVAPHCQGEGVGTQLMEALHGRLQADGIGRIYTLTARDTPAQSFYENGGFYVSPKMILMARRYGV